MSVASGSSSNKSGWSRSTSSCKLRALSVLFLGLSLSSAPASTNAARTCVKSFNDGYPYCVNVPDGASSQDGLKWPTVLMLSGRGARGDDIESLSTYDGFGKLVNEYGSGNRDEAHTLAATKFITIVPVAPNSWPSGLDPQYWYPELLTEVVNAVKQDYPVDEDRFHVAGYSMGAFGTWRFAVWNPDMIASLVPSGGNAETNSIKNSLGETVPSIMSQLSKIKTIPVRAFVGSSDTTVPPKGGQDTQSTLDGLGDTVSKLTVLSTDHSGLSVGPFDADTLNWMLQQKRGGGSSSSSSSDSSDTSSSAAPSSDDTSSSSTSSDSSSSSSQSSNSGSSSSSSGSSGTTKKKCSSAGARRKRNKRSQRAGAKHSLTLAAMLQDRKAAKEL